MTEPMKPEQKGKQVMEAPAQKQQQSAGEAAAYEWSLKRVAEGVTINVVSAFLIGGLAILGGAVYSGWILLLSALHTPAGLVGILAFVFLGAMLMLGILAIAIIAWIRGMSSAALAGMLIGALVGAALGAAIDSAKLSGKLNFDWMEKTVSSSQKTSTETGSTHE